MINDNKEESQESSWDRWSPKDNFDISPDQVKRIRRSRIWGGLFLLAAGVLLLAYKMGAPIPGWIFTWPVLLIAIGLLVGFKSRFRNPGAFIMILIGSIFLADKSIPGMDFKNYIVPIILIAVGISVMLGPAACHRRRREFFMRRKKKWYDGHSFNDPDPKTTPDGIIPEKATPDDGEGEYININAVLCGVKKNIQSKNLKGGEITSFMGGAEINFMQADIQHPIEFEVNNVFGGTKLIIPSNWDVRNEISAVFGGVEDKRNFNNNSNSDISKRILLKGACVFGGVEVTNY